MGVFTLCKFTKKHWKMKKAFCFDYFSMSQSKSKFFHVWFEFFPIYLSIKKEISETFLGLRPHKIFPRFPFFYFGNLGKTQIRRGKILLQTWHGKKSKQNTIAQHCTSKIKNLPFIEVCRKSQNKWENIPTYVIKHQHHTRTPNFG